MQTLAPCPSCHKVKTPIGQLCEACELDGESVPFTDQEFPCDVYPPRMEKYIRSLARAEAFPLPFVATAPLPLAAVAIGDKRNLRVQGRWVEPSIVWAALSGVPGAKKSPVIMEMSYPLNRLQSKMLREYQTSHGEWRMVDSKERGAEPQLHRVRCKDFTIEKLAVLLEHDKAIACVFGELLQFINQLGQYKGGRGSDRQQALDLWSGDLIDITRKGQGGETIDRFIENTRVSILGGIQPQRLNDMDPVDDGMSHRFLFAVGQPTKMKHRAGVCEDQKWWSGMFEALSLMHVAPSPIPLTTEAYDALAEFDDMLQISQDAHLTKMSGYTARLALVLGHMWMIEEGRERSVHLGDMDKAIRLARFFIGQRNELDSYLAPVIKGRPGTRAADSAYAWIMRQPGASTTGRHMLNNRVGGSETPQQRDDILETLRQQGRITTTRGPRGAVEIVGVRG